MTKIDALTMLACAVRNDEQSKINPSLTRREVVELIERVVENHKQDDLDDLLTKRVHQVVKNQKRPVY